MRRTFIVFAACVLAGSGIYQAQNGQSQIQKAAKPAPNPQVTIAFLNGPGDKITGDGSAYVGGVNGVTAEMQYPQIFFKIDSPAGKVKRYVTYIYPPGTETATPCDPNPPIGPASSAAGVKVATYVVLKSLGAIEVGETRAVRAHFGADVGEFLWLSPYNTATGACSDTVAAYRSDQWHWQLSTSIDRLTIPTGEYHGVASDGRILDAELNWVTPSDMSQLGTFTGNYRMPFALTVYCPTCTLPQPSCPNWRTNACAIPKN